MKTTALLASLALLAGYATTSERGWHGDGAQPFGPAESGCCAETAGVADAAARMSAFEACMVGKGWHRGG